MREYLSPLIGTGTEDDPFRPLIDDVVGAKWSCIDDQRTDATKREGSMKVAVESSDDEHDTLIRRSEITFLKVR